MDIKYFLVWWLKELSLITTGISVLGPHLGTIWGLLGAVALIQEVGHWGQAMKFTSSHNSQFSFCFLFAVQHVIFHLFLLPYLLPAACIHFTIMDLNSLMPKS